MLWHHLRHNRVLHERVILLTVLTEEIPWVSPAQRVNLEQLRKDVFRVAAHCGFLEIPHVPRLLRRCEQYGLKIDLNNVTYYLGRETLIPRKELGMPLWRDRLFAFMARNAARATQFYRLPPAQVVELGMQVEI
jgi:KUP system potassium uptake protein